MGETFATKHFNISALFSIFGLPAEESSHFPRNNQKVLSNKKLSVADGGFNS